LAQSFLAVARELIDSPGAKAAFGEDPDGFLAARGLEGFSAAELDDAVGFVADAVPAPAARQLAAASPDAALDPAGLARLASVTEVEEEVREAEPGTVEIAAVLNPGGELGVPDSVDMTTLVPTPEGEEETEAGGAEAANGEEADVAAIEPPDVPDVPDMEETDLVEPDLGESTGTDDDANEPDEEADGDFELDPELQPTVDPETAGDAGLPASGAVPEAPDVEIPPEETFDDLI